MLRWASRHCPLRCHLGHQALPRLIWIRVPLATTMVTTLGRTSTEQGRRDETRCNGKSCFTIIKRVRFCVRLSLGCCVMRTECPYLQPKAQGTVLQLCVSSLAKIRTVLGIIAQTVVTSNSFSGTSRQLRITGALLAVDLATVPSWDPGHCPHPDEGKTMEIQPQTSSEN